MKEEYLVKAPIIGSQIERLTAVLKESSYVLKGYQDKNYNLVDVIHDPSFDMRLILQSPVNPSREVKEVEVRGCFYQKAHIPNKLFIYYRNQNVVEELAKSKWVGWDLDSIEYNEENTGSTIIFSREKRGLTPPTSPEQQQNREATVVYDPRHPVGASSRTKERMRAMWVQEKLTLGIGSIWCVKSVDYLEGYRCIITFVHPLWADKT